MSSNETLGPVACIPRIAGLLLLSCTVFASTPASATLVTSRFESGITLATSSGTVVERNDVYADAPLGGSLNSTIAPGLKGQTSVDLGILRAFAAAPTYTSSVTGYQSAGAVAGYRDTMTFGALGDGYVSVSFSFTFDGTVIGNARGGEVDFLMAVVGPSGSVMTSLPSEINYRDGIQTDTFPGACTADQSSCSVDQLYDYTTPGIKAQTVNFVFSIIGGQAVDVFTEFYAIAGNDSGTFFGRPAVTSDFFSTARLTAITVPVGTSIRSAFQDHLVVAGGVATYTPIGSQAVPEPDVVLLLLPGLIGLGWQRRRSARRLTHLRSQSRH